MYINFNIDINMNIDIHIITNMNGQYRYPQALLAVSSRICLQTFLFWKQKVSVVCQCLYYFQDLHNIWQWWSICVNRQMFFYKSATCQAPKWIDELIGGVNRDWRSSKILVILFRLICGAILFARGGWADARESGPYYGPYIVRNM